MSMRARFWDGPGGGREVLAVGYPLILSQASYTVQTFVDRLFLTWYSPEALAGSVTASFMVATLVILFVGTGEYVTTFVAQYLGAGRDDRVGPALWQGIYFALAAGAGMALLSPLCVPLFAWAGHAPGVQAAEVAYAQVMLVGSAPAVLMGTLSSFFAGRGQARPVLAVNLLVTAVNCILDWLWIFGHGGFPRGGVAGAALATVVAQIVGVAAFAAIILQEEYRTRYRTLSGWRPERELFLRLLRFGLPAGLHYALEILAFALFMVIVGRLGTAELAASGIAFNLNMIVFMPMVGMGLGLSAVVGRHVGAGRPDLAERSTWSALGMCLTYMVACGAVYLLLPRLLLAPYAAGSDAAAFAPVGALAAVLLRYVAVYSIFDTMNVTFAAALKGAGDSAYPLRASVASSLGTLLLPTYILCVLLGYGIHAAWTAASAYVFCVGVLMLQRFRSGRWRSMRVIEAASAE